MKFFILLLGVGLVLAQEETTTDAVVTDAVTDMITDAVTDVITDAVTTDSDVTEAVTTESSGREVCEGRGKRIARTQCTEICRRPFKFGESPFFNVILTGEPCRVSRRSRENDGQCQIRESRFGRSFGVCRPLQEQAQ